LFGSPVLDRILRAEVAVTRGFGKWCATIARTDCITQKVASGRIEAEAELLGDHLAQLDGAAATTLAVDLLAPIARGAG
jgi:hypothetical protein